jgi:hypothetical protein
MALDTRFLSVPEGSASFGASFGAGDVPEASGRSETGPVSLLSDGQPDTMRDTNAMGRGSSLRQTSAYTKVGCSA